MYFFVTQTAPSHGQHYFGRELLLLALYFKAGCRLTLEQKLATTEPKWVDSVNKAWGKM